MIETILDSIYGIILTAAGLLFLLLPHDKITKIFPKAPSGPVLKILGAIIVLCGICMVALTVMASY